MTVALTVVAIMVALLAIHQGVRRLMRQVLDGTPDPALHIRSPRSYIDADGRSDLRADHYAEFVKGRAR